MKIIKRKKDKKYPIKTVRNSINYVNTTNKDNSEYWHYRSVNKYKELFSFCNLELVEQYEDLGEEISIFTGCI